ncbi:hypothetical protein PG988_005994 [Apiospora saccharicola]
MELSPLTDGVHVDGIAYGTVRSVANGTAGGSYGRNDGPETVRKNVAEAVKRAGILDDRQPSKNRNITLDKTTIEIRAVLEFRSKPSWGSYLEALRAPWSPATRGVFIPEIVCPETGFSLAGIAVVPFGMTLGSAPDSIPLELPSEVPASVAGAGLGDACKNDEPASGPSDAFAITRDAIEQAMQGVDEHVEVGGGEDDATSVTAADCAILAPSVSPGEK